jgi:hypothetical protein
MTTRQPSLATPPTPPLTPRWSASQSVLFKNPKLVFLQQITRLLLTSPTPCTDSCKTELLGRPSPVNRST